MTLEEMRSYKVLTLQEITEACKDIRPCIIHRATGLSVPTIHSFQRGTKVNFTYENVVRMSEFVRNRNEA